MKLTICGSSQFYEDWINVSNELSERGIACVIPNPVTSEEKFQNDHGRQKMLSMKPEWTKRHFERIENSDGIFVVNNKKNGIGGYIGSNTLIEIGLLSTSGRRYFSCTQ